ncbi:MAG: TonB family protein [Burkholderia sp.]
MTLTTAMRPPVALPTASTQVESRRPHKAPKTVAVLTSPRFSKRTVVVAPTHQSVNTDDVSPPQYPLVEPVTPLVDVDEKPAKTPAEPTSATPLLNLPDSQTVMEVAHIECNIPRPAYPSRARQLRHAGRVTLKLTIGTSGQVTQAEIVHTSGFDELDTAAKEALLIAHCKPYLDHGVAVAVHAQQSIDFDLKN